MTFDWGSVIKNIGPIASVAGPVAAGIAAGNARNRTEQGAYDVGAAAAAEKAKIDRGQIAVNRDRLGMDQEAQNISNAMRAALMKNMQDVAFDTSGFRSNVPSVSFTGGSRPSAIGAEGKALADVMSNRAMQSLMTSPSGGGGGAVGPGGMPEYQAAPERKGASIWENALGAAGMGATALGKIPGMFGNPAAEGTGAGRTGGGGGAAGGGGGASGGGGAAGGYVYDPYGAEALQTGSPNYVRDAIGGVAGLAGDKLMSTAAGKVSNVGGKFAQNAVDKVAGQMTGGGVMSGLNSFAGPAAMGLGLVSGFLPAGKARTAADWAGKGAQIGSMIPGVGTAIGAGIGAAAGAVKGHQNATVGDRKDAAKKLGYRSLDDLYKALETMGPYGLDLRERGLNKIGKHDEKGNQQWIGEVTALLGGRR